VACDRGPAHLAGAVLGHAQGRATAGRRICDSRRIPDRTPRPAGSAHGEINAKAAADTLEGVRIKDGEMKITPLKAITPEAAEDAAERLYGMLPNARVTSVLAEVHGWTGFANAFTHLHTGMPADDPRVVLTAILADATNLGLTRMADACSVASYRQLAWMAGLVPARGHLPAGSGHPGQRAATPSACCPIRRC